MNGLIQNGGGAAKTWWLVAAFVMLLTRSSPAPVVCSGPASPVWIEAVVGNLSILGTNNASLIFTIGSTNVGNATTLTINYTGTARNGEDFELLPSTITVFPFHTTTNLIIKPKPKYPFSTKTLTATLTNSDNACVRIGSLSNATITLIGFEPPKLAPRFISSNKLELSWVAPVPGYVLQTSTNLAPLSWVTRTNAPVGVQGTNRVTLTSSGARTFYRLMKP